MVQIFIIKIDNVPLISFYYIFVCYSVDPKLSDKHNLISIAISGGSNNNLTGVRWQRGITC